VSIELQIRSSAFEAVVTRAVQQALRRTCFEPIGGIYVDHVDVAPAPVRLAPAGAAVEIRVAVDVFAVGRDAVLGAPNGVPAGAEAPAGRADLVLEMAASGTVVSVRSVDVDLGPLGAQAAAMKAPFLAAIGSPVPFDIARILATLEMPTPGSAVVELAASTICVRFDAAGPAVDRLSPTHEWGVFLDAAAVEQLALRKVPANLSSVITSMRRIPHWWPAGTTPHVDVGYEGAAQVPDPFSGRIDGTFGFDISVLPSPAQQLRAAVSWSLNIHLGALVPSFVEDTVAQLVATALDPRQFGGTPTGPRSFYLDSRLPDLTFGGAGLAYASAVASADGMTIGGPVRLVTELDRATLQTGVTQFEDPRFVVYASQHGCTFGWGGFTPSADALKVVASVVLDRSGEFCGVEVTSPGDWLTPYVTQDAVSDESRSVNLAVPALAAVGITQPVRLIVRTSRGVRLIDFGTPHVEVDEAGNVMNAVGAYIDDCLYATISAWYWATLPVDPVTGEPLPPPPEPWPPPDWNRSNPDWLTSPPDAEAWNTYVEGLEALNVQLVTVTGLEPGELVQFRSFEHAVDVTADQSGRAVVPVLLAVRGSLEPGRLTRVGRRKLDARVTVQRAVLHWEARLPAGRPSRLVTTADGRAFVVADSDDAYQTGSLGSSRAPSIDAVRARSLRPAPVRSVDLPGLVSLVAVPGFPDQPVAFAVMDDGSTLVLEFGDGGEVRVAGTSTGPVGALEHAGEWAIASGPARVNAFRVTRA
jgi:hypothetical protein